MTTPVAQRIIRRETHRSRSIPASLSAVVVIVVLVWLATEIVLQLMGRSPLLVSVPSLFDWGVQMHPWWQMLAGGLFAILGLMMLIASLAPGRRARRVLSGDRIWAVVSDDVIADLLAKRAALAGSVSPEDVRVRVSRRHALVEITPALGQVVDPEAVTRRLDDTVTDAHLDPTLQVRTRVQPARKVS